MRIRFICLILSLPALTTGCGIMNSNFSCNATAGDSCLTIEQVDAMTQFADDEKPYMPKQRMMKASNNMSAQPGRVIKHDNNNYLWVARQAEGKSWA